MKTFEDLTAEERKEWRELPGSQALMASIARDRSSALTRVGESLKAGSADVTRLDHLGGQLAFADNLLAMVKRS